MSDQTKNFLGLPIEGEIYRYGHRSVIQRPLEEFTPLLEALMSRPEVTGIRWRQYTPYFNDGDTCTFGVSDVYIRCADFSTEGGDYDDGFVSEWEIKKEPEEYPCSQETLTAYKALTSGMYPGSFNDVLLDLFGDHAIVTVCPGQKITVETYEHD